MEVYPYTGCNHCQISFLCACVRLCVEGDSGVCVWGGGRGGGRGR